MPVATSRAAATLADGRYVPEMSLQNVEGVNPSFFDMLRCVVVFMTTFYFRHGNIATKSFQKKHFIFEKTSYNVFKEEIFMKKPTIEQAFGAASRKAESMSGRGFQAVVGRMARLSFSRCNGQRLISSGGLSLSPRRRRAASPCESWPSRHAFWRCCNDGGMKIVKRRSARAGGPDGSSTTTAARCNQSGKGGKRR